MKSKIKTPDVSIILVNFNGGRTVLNCLRSLFLQTCDLCYEVFIVDNASTDGSAKKIRNTFPEVFLIENPTNAGYSCACNQAIRVSKGKTVILLNSDTILMNNAVRMMMDFFEKNSKAGIAGCMLLNEDGTYQKSAGGVRSIVNEWKEKWVRTGLDRQMQTAWKIEERFSRNIQSVDWVSGAFLMIRRSVINRIGLLDERMFLFFEDIEWCTRARKAGYEVLYNPHVRVMHLGGKSIAHNEVKSLLEYRRSQLLFYKTHYGSGLDTGILRLYLVARALYGSTTNEISVRMGSPDQGEGPIDKRQMFAELFRIVRRG